MTCSPRFLNVSKFVMQSLELKLDDISQNQFEGVSMFEISWGWFAHGTFKLQGFYILADNSSGSKCLGGRCMRGRDITGETVRRFRSNLLQRCRYSYLESHEDRYFFFGDFPPPNCKLE